MVVRSFFRVPMGVFDEYRNLSFKYPRAMNFFMTYSIIVAIMYFGKGFEKMAMQGEQSSHEWNRRARRFFMPYSLVSYKWRFPSNQ